MSSKLSSKQIAKNAKLRMKEQRIKKLGRKLTTVLSLNTGEVVTSVHVPCPRTDGKDGQILLEPLPDHLKQYGPTYTELAEFFGDEWEPHCEDPHWLAGAVKMLQEKNMVEAGVCPPWYQYRATCKHCGPVKIPELWSPPTVEGCQWCHTQNKPDFS